MAQERTLELVSDLEDPFWKLTPPGLNTNINWQVGHITVGLYFQALVCIAGEREALKNLIPIQELIRLYKIGTQPAENLPAKPDKETLLKSLKLVYRQVDVALNSLTPTDLDLPTAVQHPVAKNRREVLSWCSHHQMWHNGVIAVLKRILVGKSL